MNTLTSEKLNEIRNSVNIVDIISSYINLSPKGKNYFGVCPFHDDNNPSMSVSPDKQIYKCFSCGATGTVFKFIMDYENITFKEAVQKVADIGGIQIEIHQTKKRKENNTLYDIYNLSLKYYINNLNTPKGKEAKEYLKKRNINEDIVKEFQIGLSLTDNNILANILTKKFKEKDILKTGLIGKSDYGYYDLFRDRIMFPLYDLKGKVIAYSGRIYNKKDNSKYFNTRETEIFKKGELLYNYHRAKDIARRKNQIIIMEGFMDVIRAHSVNIKNVIATMGTAVTSTQANLIKRMAKEIILCFDGDEAGAKATKSCAEELNKIGVTPKVVRLEENLDPDEYIQKYGKEAFQRKIDNPINIMDFELDYLKQGKNLESAEDTAEYINQIIKEINKIDDEILKEVTIKKIVDETKIDENIIRNHLDKKTKKIPKKEIKQNLTKYEKAEKNLIYYMLNSEDVIREYDKNVTYMPDREYRLLAREISTFYKNYGQMNEADFIDYIEGDKELTQTIKKVNQNMLSENYTEEEIKDYIKAIKEYNIKDAIERMQEKMKKQTDPLKKAEIAQQIINLKKEL
ncbi:MAG: DNA primase [Bacilli bacterium]|nr:DNA primase [Bacilli bacterium]